MASVDLYAALQVARGADNATIKQSFKKLALQWHPDKNSGSSEAQEQFQRINEAYAILSDSDKRAFYDRATSFLNRGGQRDGSSFGFDLSSQKQSSTGHFSPNSTSQTWDENRQPSRPKSSYHPGTPRDEVNNSSAPSYSRVVTKTLRVSLEELFYGFHKRLKVSRKIEDMEGNIAVSSVILTVNGLPGWRSGTRVTFSEAGDKKFGLPAQDITIVVEEEPHAVFQRRGDDLIMHIQIPLLNALYGHTEHIEAIDGKKINVPITRVTVGMLISLPGEGMPSSRGERGNLLLKYKIIIPTFAADSIRAVTALSQGPTDWREVEMQCRGCWELFRDVDNTDDSCFSHDGTLVARRAASAAERHLVWSCCGRSEGALGCICHGPHSMDDAERIKARAKAGYNGLLAAASVGDVYAAAWFLLDCSVAMQLPPIRAAVAQGHFMVTMLFVRDGADLGSLGGPLAALELAASHDNQLSSQLIQAIDSDSELFNLFASIPGAAQIAFAHGCRRGDTALCQRLLLHPRVGPARCAIGANSNLASALMLSCARVGDVRCLHVLLEAGVDANAVEPETQRTALHYAAQHGHADALELLLLACVRTSERDSQDMRPVDRAVAGQHGECVVLLETAMLEEALLSMAGLSVLRLLSDSLVTHAAHWAQRPTTLATDLRPAILIMEDALRNLCGLSQDLSGCSVITGEVDPTVALECYTEWREALGANDDVFTRNQAARSAVDALISAGVSVKTSYQELLASAMAD